MIDTVGEGVFARHRPPRPSRRGGAVYLCAHCDRPIETEWVVSIEAERVDAGSRPVALERNTGYMLITHHCPCSKLVLTSRRRGSYPGFVALFGKGVRLPYVSPFHLREVDDDDPLLVRWRWELEQTADVEEFLDWLNR